MTRILFAALVSMIGLPATAHETTKLTDGTRTTLVYEHELPDVPGKSLKGVLVEYAPGAANPSHTHAPSALIYATVLEGKVKTQVNGGPVSILGVGENFTELPGSFHDISANASATEPAKLLAVFVVNSDENPLTIPAPDQ
jgi:quercetin dioxygenase-like cupin family protein